MNEIKYSITIRDESESKEQTVATSAASVQQTDAAPGAPMTSKSTTAASNAGKLTTALVAVKTVEPYVNQAVSFAVSRVEFATGSTELQQRAQVFSSAASSAYSIGMAAAVGGLPAAAVMAGGQLLQTAITSIQTATTIREQKALEGETIANRRSRIGAISNRSRGASG